MAKENALQRRLTISPGSSQHRYGYVTFGTLLCGWIDVLRNKYCSTFPCFYKGDPTAYHWLSVPLRKTLFCNRRRIVRCYVSMNSSVVIFGISLCALQSCTYIPVMIYIGFEQFIRKAEWWNLVKLTKCMVGLKSKVLSCGNSPSRPGKTTSRQGVSMWRNGDTPQRNDVTP